MQDAARSGTAYATADGECKVDGGGIRTQQQQLRHGLHNMSTPKHVTTVRHNTSKQDMLVCVALGLLAGPDGLPLALDRDNMAAAATQC